MKEKERSGLEFRRVLAKFAETGDNKLESALRAWGIVLPRANRKLTLCQVQAAD